MPRFLSALCLVMLAACDAGIDEQAVAPVAPAAVPARRCPQCGWIESKREIPPGTVYEYTVRMADGSSRVFQEALPVSWRVRERLVFIDGSGPLN